jgi:hypothetical protein
MRLWQWVLMWVWLARLQAIDTGGKVAGEQREGRRLEDGHGP